MANERADVRLSKGGYKMLRRLGAGMSGDLYLARHKATSEYCAVRRLPLALLSKAQPARLLLEILLRVQRISHPQVNPVHVIFRRRGQIYAVLGYVEGVDLQQVFACLERAGPLPAHLATRIALQICYGLDCAHRQVSNDEPLVHGSLWPTNIRLNRNGDAVVMDFGSWIAHAALWDEQSAASSGLTLAYRSPEQVEGTPPTPSSDVFCVGVLLYQMLTGMPPFGSGRPEVILERVRQARVEPLTSLPKAFQPIVERALCRDPLCRHPDVTLLIAELIQAAPEANAPNAVLELAALVQSLSDPARESSQPAAVLGLRRIPTAARRAIFDDAEPDHFSTLVAPEPLAPIVGTAEIVVDIPTPVSPVGMVEALAALSKRKTDPMAFGDVIDHLGALLPAEEADAADADGQSQRPQFVVEGGQLRDEASAEIDLQHPPSFDPDPDQPTLTDNSEYEQEGQTIDELAPPAREMLQAAQQGERSATEDLPRALVPRVSSVATAEVAAPAPPPSELSFVRAVSSVRTASSAESATNRDTRAPKSWGADDAPLLKPDTDVDAVSEGSSAHRETVATAQHEEPDPVPGAQREERGTVMANPLRGRGKAAAANLPAPLPPLFNDAPAGGERPAGTRAGADGPLVFSASEAVDPVGSSEDVGYEDEAGTRVPPDGSSRGSSKAYLFLLIAASAFVLALTVFIVRKLL